MAEELHLSIIGSGGGGKDAGASTSGGTQEDPNTLLSISYVRFVHLVCEGEVEGLVDGMKSVFLNDTPLLANVETGSTLYKNCSFTINSTAVTLTDEGGDAFTGLTVGMDVLAPSMPTGAKIIGLNPALNIVYVSPPPTSSGSSQVTFVSGPSASNFKDFTLLYRYGTQDQDHIPGFDTVETNISGLSVNAPIEVASPNVSTISDTEANAARVSIYTPSFVKQIISGSSVHLTGVYVQYAIDVKPFSGSYVTVVNDAFDGKCTSPYVRSHRVDLPGAGPWTIRVRRITPDSTDSNTVDKIYLYSIFSLVDTKLSYPNSVIFAGQFDAKQFSSIPNVTYYLKLLKIKVPANYDPTARTYATTGPGTSGGVWDGTFKVAWSDNPAWVFYDLVTNARYGLGSFIQVTSIDKWELYTIAQYCDQLVPSGYTAADVSTPEVYLTEANCTELIASMTPDQREPIINEATAQYDSPGHWLFLHLTAHPESAVNQQLIDFLSLKPEYQTQEPRFTCNLFIQSREEAFRVLANLASVFRGIVYWANGQIKFLQDSPIDPEVTFTPANVKDGLFTYQGSSIKGRHTVALVSWNDPSQMSQRRVEYVEDTDAVRENGINELELVAVGCNSRGQARRVGRWALYAEQNETEMVGFETALDSLSVYPGQIINIVDPNRAGARMGGRLLAASTTSITIDAPITMTAGKTYTAILINPDGVLVLRPLTNANAANQTILNFAIPLPSADVPNVNTVWAVSVNDLVPQQFRVLFVEESSPTTAKINALSYNPGKYDWIERNIPFEKLPITQLNGSVASVLPPSNFIVREEYDMVPEGLQRFLICSWVHSLDPYLKDYTVSFRYENTNWQSLPNTDANTLSFPVRIRAKYIVRICANNRLGRHSPFLYAYYDLNEDLLEQGAITGLELFGQGNNTIFTGKDPHFVWRFNSPNSAVGGDSALNNPLLKNFLVEMWDARHTPPVLLRREDVTEPSYIYTYDKNETDTQGDACRDLIIKVAARDLVGHVSRAAELEVTNPQPELGQFPPTIDTDLIRVSSKGGQLFVNYDRPADADFAGLLIFGKQGDDLQLADLLDTQDNPTLTALRSYYLNNNGVWSGGYLLYAGSDTHIALPLSSLDDYSLVFAPYDDFGYDGLNYYGPVQTKILLEVDTTPPEVPSGLTVTAEATIDTDGNQKVILRAKWLPNSEEDLFQYGWSIRQVTGTPTFDVDGNLTGYSSVAQPYLPVFGGLPARTESNGYVQGPDGYVTVEWIVKADTYYEVRVNASDTSSNASAWTPLNNLCVIYTVPDTIPPAVPEWVSSDVAFRFVRLKWTNPTDDDFWQVRLYESTTNDSATATEIRQTGSDFAEIQYNLTGQLTSTTRYFWLKSEDNNGNTSEFSTVRSVTLPEIVAPTNLTLNSEVVIDADGHQAVYIMANWTNPNGSVENRNFYWELGESVGSFDKNSGTTQGTSIRIRAIGNKYYSFRVRVEDVNAGYSPWTESSLTTLKDTTPPAQPGWSTCVAQYRSLFLSWNPSTEPDFAGFDLYENTVPTFGTATLIRTNYKGHSVVLPLSLTEQFSGLVRHYWLIAKDTSGNSSAVSAIQSISIGGIQPPSGLSLASSLVFDTDGRQQVFLTVTWTPTTFPEFSSYSIEVSTSAGQANRARLTITNQSQGSVRIPVEGATLYYVRMRVNDSNNGFSAWTTELSITSAADTTPPDLPTGLAVTSAIRSAYLEWTNPSDSDLAGVAIYRATTNVFPGGTPYASLYGTAFVDANVVQGTTYYYWLKAFDRSGNYSSQTSSVNTTPGKVATSDINDFAVGMTQRYHSTVALQNDSWTNNSPTSPAIAWNSHTLYYQGTAYTISAGNTTNGWVYWDSASPTVYQTSATNPALTDGQFMIATNVSGAHDLAWNAMANALIGTAYIENLAVTNAKVLSLAVDKLTAGSITGQVFTLAAAGAVNAVLKSSNYNGTIDANNAVTAAGTAGLFMNSAGYFECSNALIRGDIKGGTIAIGSDAFQVDSSGNLWMGASTFASAPFKVSNTGVLTASGATITGSAVASSLAVGTTFILGDASHTTSSIMQSYDYVADTSGWILRGDGYFETNEAKIRGDLVAGTITIGTGDNIFKVDGTGNVWLGNAAQASAGVRMDKDGYFQLGPNASPKLTFTPGTGVLSVAGYIQVGGAASDVNSNATTISGGKITASSVTATQLAATITTTKELVIDVGGIIRSIGATSATVGDGFWIKSVTGTTEFRFGNPSGPRISWDGATLALSGAINLTGLTTLATVATTGAWTDISGKPTSFSSLVTGFSAPSGTGLFLDSTHMGYYNGSAWSTYWDSSGNFYLGGTGGALTFNGGTGVLVVQGSSTFKGVVDIGTSGAHCVVNSSSFTFGTGTPFVLSEDNTYVSGGSKLSFGGFSIINPSSTASNLTVDGEIMGGSSHAWAILANDGLGASDAFSAGGDSVQLLIDYPSALARGGRVMANGEVRAWSDSSGITSASFLYGPNNGDTQTAYAMTVIHRDNTTSKYGLFVGTNWQAVENRILTLASVDASTGSATDRFHVGGLGEIFFDSVATAASAGASQGYFYITINGTKRKVEYFAET